MIPNVLLITILVLIIVLFIKYVYLIVFGLPYKYINYYNLCPLLCLQNVKLKFVSSFITRNKDEKVCT
jgi:hypothetical protein